MNTAPQATATASSRGIGVFGLTFVVLLVLKLTGLATLSWFWVFSPLIAAVVWVAFWIILLLAIVIFAEK